MDYMVLGVIAALALFVWRVIRIQKREGTGSCHGCSNACPLQKRQEEEK